MRLSVAFVTFMASAVMAQTEPPICDPADMLPTGEQGIDHFEKRTLLCECVYRISP